MNPIKKVFTSLTGYWIHKVQTLPPGMNLFIDIKNRIGYGTIDMIFDVGANIGQTRKEFREYEPDSLIYCFEPVAETFKELCGATKHDTKCIKEHIALADFVGEKTISIFDGVSPLNSLKEDIMNKSNNTKRERIRVDTLDNYCLNKKIDYIDLLKIDTEGFELPVLKGSKRMLSSKKIAFIYAEAGLNENDNRHTPFCVLNNWLQYFDYYFFAMYQLAGHSWKEGGYYANALFVHRDLYNP